MKTVSLESMATRSDWDRSRRFSDSAMTSRSSGPERERVGGHVLDAEAISTPRRAGRHLGLRARGLVRLRVVWLARVRRVLSVPSRATSSTTRRRGTEEIARYLLHRRHVRRAAMGVGRTRTSTWSRLSLDTPKLARSMSTFVDIARTASSAIAPGLRSSRAPDAQPKDDDRRFSDERHLRARGGGIRTLHVALGRAWPSATGGRAGACSSGRARTRSPTHERAGPPQARIAPSLPEGCGPRKQWSVGRAAIRLGVDPHARRHAGPSPRGRTPLLGGTARSAKGPRTEGEGRHEQRIARRFSSRRWQPACR